MLAELNTDSVAADRRLDFWREKIADLFKVDQKIECSSRESFQAQLRIYKLAAFRFIESAGSPRKSTVSQGSQEDSFSLVIPLKGDSRLAQDGRVAMVGPNAIGMLNLAHPYEITMLTHYRHISVNIPGRDLRNLFPACDQVTATTVPVSEGIGAVFLDMVKSLQTRIQNVEDQPSVASAVADSFSNLLRATLYSVALDPAAAPSSRLEVYHRDRIKSYVKANLRTNLNVELIAAAVGLSVRYVHSLFESETLSLMKWVWSERVDACRNDLVLPALRGRSVSEIAYSWGYNDPAHFSRVFRERFGISPSRYREQMLEKGRAPGAAAVNEAPTLRAT